MRLIKAFLAGIIGLFIFITLFSLLIPFEVRLSRVVLINNASTSEVFSQISHFDDWKNWHPVFTVDSAKLSLHPASGAGKDSGCTIMHHGKEATITVLSSDSNSFKFLMQAASENDIVNDIVITPLTTQDAVQVEWKAITKLHWYPWEKFYGIFVDKLTGPGYEAALNGLKNYIEKSPHLSNNGN